MNETENEQLRGYLRDGVVFSEQDRSCDKFKAWGRAVAKAFPDVYSWPSSTGEKAK